MPDDALNKIALHKSNSGMSRPPLSPNSAVDGHEHVFPPRSKSHLKVSRFLPRESKVRI